MEFIILMSFIRAFMTLNEDHVEKFADEGKFGFLLSLLSTFLWMWLFSFFVGGIPTGFFNILGYLILELFLFIVSIPFSIMLLKLFFKGNK